MSTVTGIHHVTCIAGDPQENVDFYTGTLGMRLVKKSVNQDVPDTYHLFYADGEGHPGADLTFFPWPKLPPVQKGAGLAVEVSLAIPKGSLEYWEDRLATTGANTGDREVRHGEHALRLTDPHGLELALVETGDEREFGPWSQSPVPPAHQIRGLHAVRLWERDVAQTASFLAETMGFAMVGEENGWRRYAIAGGGSGRHLDIRAMPNEQRGSWGTGGIHHVAWRVPDDATELAVRERLAAAKRRPTEVIDRFWFKSVYFLEPGGVLFEIATDGPGFAVDEDLATLGEHLVLPPWLEPHRREIEDALPPLAVRV
jgi:glyoxalase family protein